MMTVTQVMTVAQSPEILCDPTPQEKVRLPGTARTIRYATEQHLTFIQLATGENRARVWPRNASLIERNLRR
jgi:hypothetical protein